ncbi:MAG: oxygen-independent coproporphyrinogen III oxidase [Crocinitomicaceae bacterium]|nr:oxygen-independent coproporphyrinogen III oxidase [Crocinitomicaceae bacterium]
MSNLVEKYNVPGPRYTSYPTVPFWKNNPLTIEDWTGTIARNSKEFASNDLSLYIHLPYCESLCTFCGCHKRITKNHAVEGPYIDAVIKEWELYKKDFNFTPEIKELHFGGGTPTFFSPDQLIRLVESIFNKESVDSTKTELGFEAHPNNTSEEHLEKLYAFGFRRLSLGIQDYSPTVQQAINRVQPYENVKLVHDQARALGYTSISHDLVFGLPKQHIGDIIDTVEKTLTLRPDRISLYSYAHVPWIKGNGQRGYDESDLPQDNEKRDLYLKAKSLLEEQGYLEIGMDHFALPHDDLAKAFNAKNLHRNFMGYTTQNTPFLLGLGMSAISDSWFGFAQNEKVTETYIERVNNNEIPIFRGHVLSDLDVEIRTYILDLMCHFETEFAGDSATPELHTSIVDRLDEMISDGLVIVDGKKVTVTDEGIAFVRNCCMAFDQDLANNQQRENMFSKTV